MCSGQVHACCVLLSCEFTFAFQTEGSYLVATCSTPALKAHVGQGQSGTSFRYVILQSLAVHAMGRAGGLPLHLPCSMKPGWLLQPCTFYGGELIPRLGQEITNVSIAGRQCANSSECLGANRYLC